MKYKCINEKCPVFGEVKTESKSTSKFVGGKLVDSAAPCPECGEVREYQRGKIGAPMIVTSNPNERNKF